MAYKLTEKREEKATPMLEEAFEFLVKTEGGSLPAGFERDLMACWGFSSYKTLKPIMSDMLRHERYKYLAVAYMEKPGLNAIVSEFKSPLAKLHGHRSFNPEKYKEDRKQFWNEFISCYCC